MNAAHLASLNLPRGWRFLNIEFFDAEFIRNDGSILIVDCYELDILDRLNDFDKRHPLCHECLSSRAVAQGLCSSCYSTYNGRYWHLALIDDVAYEQEKRPKYQWGRPSQLKK